MRWNFHVSPSRTIVCPALLPPWKRTTSSACSASRSTTLPFPSSPHWAPTMTSPGMARASVGAWSSALGALRHPQVLAPHRQRLLADLAQAGHGARADLAAQPRDWVEVGNAVDAGQLTRHPLEPLDDAAQGLVVVARAVAAAGFAQLLRPLAQELDRGVGVRVGHVRGDDDRPLVLPALVDDRVELLQYPLGLLLGAEVVEDEHVDGAEPAEEAEVGVARVAVEGALDLGEQTRHGVDRVRAADLLGLLGDQDRQRGLAGARRAVEPQPTAGVEVAVDVRHERPHGREDRAVERDDRLAVEGDLEEAAADAGSGAAADGLAHALLAAAAGARV